MAVVLDCDGFDSDMILEKVQLKSASIAGNAVIFNEAYFN